MSKKLGNLDIIIEKTGKSVAKKLSEDLYFYLIKANEQNIKVLFLSSGGSAFSVLDYINNNVFGEYLTIGVLDERYDETNENNNFTEISRTDFYRRAKKAGCDFIDTSVKENQTQVQLANYFEKELEEWVCKNPNGKIVATMGVGVDGHTSGMMPFNEDSERFTELFESNKWVISYDATGKNQFTKRITTSITFLKKIDRVFVFITGHEKAYIFSRIIEDGLLSEVPSRIIKKLNGSVYVDEEVLKE